MRDWYRGCVLGGAMGDALGAGTEFLSLAESRRRHRSAGVTGHVLACGRTGAITDDTQMSLFTAEGLLREQQQPPSRRDAPPAIWRAYRRWLLTQSPGDYAVGDGWLIRQDFLRNERGPSLTCLSALHGGYAGSLRHPVNVQRLRRRHARRTDRAGLRRSVHARISRPGRRAGLAGVLRSR